jgi:SAM-dependent methyltransferase
MLKLDLASRCCPVCDNNDSARLFVEGNINLDLYDRFAFASRKVPEYMHWRLWECGACDVVYANPAPLAGQLASLYLDAAFSSSVEAQYAGRTYGRLLKRIAARLPDRLQAMDIGNGDGAFLNELLDEQFSRVIGIEASAAPIASADPRVRPLIRHESFQPGSFSEGEFSLITCFQTIEHVSEPMALTREVWRILKPGGALFLIGHNRRALSAKVLGFRSPIFDIEHLQLFSTRSFSRMLDRAGFRRVEVRPFLNAYPISYWSQLLPFPKRLKQAVLTILDRTRVGKISIPLPAGNLAAVAYK